MRQSRTTFFHYLRADKLTTSSPLDIVEGRAKHLRIDAHASAVAAAYSSRNNGWSIGVVRNASSILSCSPLNRSIMCDPSLTWPFGLNVSAVRFIPRT